MESSESGDVSVESGSQDAIVVASDEETPNEEQKNAIESIINDDTQKQPPQRKERGIPKKILENQMKYLQELEKQQRMSKKTKSITNDKNKKVESFVTENQDTTGMVRMVVNGKVKFIPVNKPPENVIETKKNEVIIESINNNPPIYKEIIETPVCEKIIETPVVKQEVIIKKKPCNNGNGNRLPSRYAKQIENDVKKTTVRNVKNFSDLRRVKEMENLEIESGIDLNRASMIELRKLKAEQKKREMSMAKKQAELNKRESAVKNIMSDEKMSKFSKTVAIKNLSVNSRHQKCK